MTHGTQLDAGDAVGGPPPADAPAPGDATGPVAVPARRRTSLAVIPRRATGTHTAIPALDAPVDPLATTPHAALAARTGAGTAARRRVGLLSAAAVLLATAVAVPLWLDRDRPTSTALPVTPVGAALPGAATRPDDPGAPGAPLDPAEPSTAPSEEIQPEFWMPTPTGPAADTETVPPTAPTGAVTTPARRPDDANTGDPAGRGTPQEIPTTRPPVRDTPQDPPTFSARGNPAGRNLALGRQVFASSFTNRLRSPEQAVDGKLLSRWSTRATDEQWIAVDLGDTFRIRSVRIAWELAFANTYRVDLSTDGRSWTSVWQTRAGLGGTVGVPMDDDAAARFVRVYGVRPAGPLGYSIRELDVR